MVEVGGAGRDLWRYLIQPPSSQQSQLEQVAQDHIQPGFEYLQGWSLHNLPGQAVQCLVTLKVKMFVFLCTGTWGYSSPGAGLGIFLC